MTDNEIILNGKTYILKEDATKNDGIMDVYNVSMFVDLKELMKEDKNDDSFIELRKPNLKFKFYKNFYDADIYFNKETFIIFNKGHKNVWGLEFQKRFNWMISALDCDKSIQQHNHMIYLLWDSVKKEYKNDSPCMLVTLGYGLVLAPRVDGN